MKTLERSKDNSGEGYGIDIAGKHESVSSPQMQGTRRARLRGRSVDEQERALSSTPTCLNASFDMSILRSKSRAQTPRAVSSWDEHDNHDDGEQVRRKHLRTSLSEENIGMLPPSTGRKVTRRATSDSPGGANTPARHLSRLTSATKTKKRQPTASTARSQKRPSPMRTVALKTPRDMFGARSLNGFTPGRPFHPTADPKVARVSTSGGPLVNSVELTPFGFPCKKAPCHTVATLATKASTLLDVASDACDSLDTESSTPFRFTTFPASLPRIYEVRHEERPCPFSVRKRMSFGENMGILNGSRDDTQNTSISSLLCDLHEDDDESTGSPLGTPVTKTRLDFSGVFRPLRPKQVLEGMNIDRDRGDLYGLYEQKRVNSFASSVSSITSAKNPSVTDEANTASTTCMTPSRGSQSSRCDEFAPRTPGEVQLHFQLDAAQCSPIPGIPEEEGDMSSKSDGQNLSAHSKLSLSQTSTTATDSQSSRPLPDMTAFDDEGLSSSQDRSTDDTIYSIRSNPTSPKYLCPPTPVRTPAWAQFEVHSASNLHLSGKGKLGRANSLIATKVLATCSPQLLGGMPILDRYLLNEKDRGQYSEPLQKKEKPIDDDEFLGDGDAWLHVNNRYPITTPSVPHKITPASTISLAGSFDVLTTLGSGNFADVFKVRSKVDGRLYAVKKNRRQFRGRRDRESALSEVRSMQHLQGPLDKNGKSACPNLLFFIQAWQEDGHFLVQTELCSRVTCEDLLNSVRQLWTESMMKYKCFRELPNFPGQNGPSEAGDRTLPEDTVLKVFHDISAGLNHIHSHGYVHNDIKPANIFFVFDDDVGPVCKIGDFGLAGKVGSLDDGQEGDQKFMAPELLASCVTSTAADIFSLGLTIYKLAADCSFNLPSEGPRWQEIRSGNHTVLIPSGRNPEIKQFIQLMISRQPGERPSAAVILQSDLIQSAASKRGGFLEAFLREVEDFDKLEEIQTASNCNDDQTPRHAGRPRVCSPSFHVLKPPMAPILYSPEAAT